METRKRRGFPQDLGKASMRNSRLYHTFHKRRRRRPQPNAALTGTGFGTAVFFHEKLPTTNREDRLCQGVSRAVLLASSITERKSAARKQRTYRPTSLRGDLAFNPTFGNNEMRILRRALCPRWALPNRLLQGTSAMAAMLARFIGMASENG